MPSGITLTLLSESSTLALSRLRRTYGPSEGEGTGLLPSPSRLMGLAHPPCFIDISAMLQSNMADMSLPRGEGTPRPRRLRGWIPALGGRNDGEGEGKAISRSHLRGGKGNQERCWYGEGRATSRACLKSCTTPHFSLFHDLDSCLRHPSHWSRISNWAVFNGLMRQAQPVAPTGRDGSRSGGWNGGRGGAVSRGRIVALFRPGRRA